MNAQLYENLLAAVKTNNLKKTKNLLDKHGLILNDDFSDYKLLIQALHLGNKQIAKLLLDNSCRVFCQQKTGVYNTPLYYAVNMKCLDLVTILLDKGASFGGKDANKETPLVFAVKNKYFEIVDLMLSKYKIENTNINNEDEVSHFHIACMRNNTRLVKNFLEHGMKVDQISSILPGYTPLHIAVKYNCKETVQFLLDHKADVNNNKSIGNGATPLHLAIENNNRDVVKLLLQYNADVCAVDNDQNTPIHKVFEITEAVCTDPIEEEIKKLLFSDHRGKLKNISNKIGVSLFHLACLDEPHIVEYFLKQNVDINACIKKNVKSAWAGYSPLHFAVAGCNLKVIQTLMQYKDTLKMTDANGKSIISWVCAHWFMEVIRESSILQLASKSLKIQTIEAALLEILPTRDDQRGQVLKLLLKSKTDVNVALEKTLMIDVCQMVHSYLERTKNETINTQDEMYQLKMKRIGTFFKQIIIILLDHGQDVNSITLYKSAVLHYLIHILKLYYNNSIIEIIELLLIHGAQVDIETEDGVTPLMMAAAHGFDKVVEILLRFKANVNKHSYSTCMTPLLFAVGSTILNTGNAKYILTVVDLLLAKGAKVDVKTINNYSPLHCVAEFPYMHKGMLRLLEYNCNVNSKNNHGNTALHIACMNRNLPGMTTLLNFGANINLVNNSKATPLEIMFIPSEEMLLYDTENCEMLKIFELHIIKLKVIGFKVSKQNNYFCKSIKNFCNADQMFLNATSRNYSITNDEDNTFIDFCKRELDRMRRTKIDIYTSLYSIIFKNSHEVARHVNNENFKELVISRELKQQFPLYGYIIYLQYKKGLERYALLKPAKDVLKKTLFGLPELCYDRILAFFSNQELEKLRI